MTIVSDMGKGIIPPMNIKCHSVIFEFFNLTPTSKDTHKIVKNQVFSLESFSYLCHLKTINP
jgi:hypothetical protein